MWDIDLDFGQGFHTEQPSMNPFSILTWWTWVFQIIDCVIYLVSCFHIKNTANMAANMATASGI